VITTKSVRLARMALGCLVAVAGCAAADDTDESASAEVVAGDGASAFRNVRRSLEDELRSGTSRTETIVVDSRTTGRMITSIVPAKNTTTASTRGATPRALEGVYWMRGNPLADYLLSFANIHWTDDGRGTPYGYLSISSPGSFAFKKKAVAQGAVDGDFRFLPEVCRVPREDRTMQRIADAPTTHDPSTFRRSIAEDLQVALSEAGTVPASKSEEFLSSIQTAGQMPLEGAELLSMAQSAHAFYESRWSPSFTEGSVQVVFVATAPGLLRSLIPPFRLPVPEWLGSFSLAPHPEDRDVFLRKTFIVGTGAPNYYFLTRIVDGEGRELPHFKEFIQCVGERSGGEILKVTH
jgi:hypothetical protein